MRHPFGLHTLWLLLVMGLVACSSYTPPVGTIVIDTDLPYLHDGELPIGVTLDMGSEGKDLLSTNLIVNGSFDLAPRLRDGFYNTQKHTVTTPNKFTTYYPLPQYLHGWDVLRGNVSLVSGQTSPELPPSHQLLLSITGREPEVKIQHTGFPLSIRPGDRLQFTCKGRTNGGVKVMLQLVDDSLKVVSDQVELAGLGAEWSEASAIITAKDSLPDASLLITASLSSGEEGRYFLDDEGNWHSVPSYIWLDDCAFFVETLQTKDGISTELHQLLSAFSPEFIRFPGGKTANGFYPGTYPLHLDSLEQTPFWTLPGAEYTGSFTYHHLISLAKSLEAVPVLLTNFGMTDPSAEQRIEGLQLIEKRAKYIAELYTSGSSDLIIQPGYNLTSDEYQKRFQLLLHFLAKDSVTPNLITGGALTPNQSYSDFTTDLALPPLEEPSLHHYLPAPDSAFYLTEPLVLGEVHFAPLDSSSYTRSQLIQRATILLQAERFSGALQGITLSPLLASPKSGVLPLIYYHAARFEPTLLYNFLQYYQTWRGSQVRHVSITPATKSLHISLTSDPEGDNFYLKVVNSTRHPLPYLISFQGLYSNFSRFKRVHYTSQIGHFEEVAEEKIPAIGGLHYTFEPHEIVIFHFKK